MEAIIRTAFQPIMSDRGNVVAYEALLRFREGLDKPDSREVMIRRWEDCGYISTVDVSVLKQASAALGMLHSSLLVSVNVSMVTLNTDRDRYLRHLDSLGDKAKKLIVEVTNTASQSDPTVLLKFARECAARNVRLALDDFVPDRPKSMADRALARAAEADQARPQGGLGRRSRPSRTATSASSSRPRPRSTRAWSRRASTARRSSTGRSGSACATSRASSSGIRASFRCSTRKPRSATSRTR